MNPEDLERLACLQLEDLIHHLREVCDYAEYQLDNGCRAYLVREYLTGQLKGAV